MTAPTMVILVVFTAALGIVSAALRRRALRFEHRLESLSQPLHELRGALGALELGLSLLERPLPDVNGSIDGLRHSLQRATLGAEDVDAIRRGDAGATARAHVNLNTLVLRSARAWKLLAPSFEATVDVDWRAGPVQVKGHAGRLQQALDNVIANALEHGGGRVLVEGERRGRCVGVLVSDDGHGISRPDGTLDERGSRSAGASNRGHGLEIVRAVVLEHGGRLRYGTGRHGPGLLIELPTVDGDGGASVHLGLRECGVNRGYVASNAA